MPVGITDLAHSLRKDTAGSAVTIPLSRGQQLVAAAMGHKSLASFQAARAAHREPQTLDGVPHVVPDYELLSARAQELGLGLPNNQLRGLMDAAFHERLPRTKVHHTFSDLAMAVQDEMQEAVLSDAGLNSSMANANYDGIDEVYFEEEIDPDEATLAEPVTANINGHIGLGIDTERPYAGHQVRFEVAVSLARCGRRCFEEPAVEVLSGGLDYDWDGDTPPTKTLAQALAEALKIDLADAQELADVEPTELSGHSDGMTYGYLFDFTRRVRPELAAKLMAQHGSLQLEVQPWFFDGIRGAD
ncbi:hypothetical protein [uncultured Aquimonas sp.]|uniref:hypothetical protein n=1 Tax=uncultured Aquimonas sp. TaxID=385483 RepID=UPI00086E9195|nr:hypothetical protein [uncultured Aquimonas sp.]ODU09277.1 MAG: hypothetical protein ABS84_09755 [Rubrivivax sp. SCN 71-131]